MFNVFKKILAKQKVTEEDLDKISEFVMMNWLSGDNVGVSIAQVFNVYGPYIPIDAKVKFIQGVMPYNKKYIKYPKKPKNQDEHIEIISKYYNVNLNQAKELLSLMDDEQLIETVNVVRSQESAKLKGRG